jgi:hypothetical protein
MEQKIPQITPLEDIYKCFVNAEITYQNHSVFSNQFDNSAS